MNHSQNVGGGFTLVCCVVAVVADVRWSLTPSYSTALDSNASAVVVAVVAVVVVVVDRSR
jgi:hypothetical protein